MTSSTEIRNRRERQKQCEAEGVVADSMDVRRDLMTRVHAGEITLEAAQAELKRIQRREKANGKITRNQAYRGY